MKANKILVIMPMLIVSLSSCDPDSSDSGKTISQAAMNSVSSAFKAQGTYKMEDITEPEYSGEGVITTIYAENRYYAYDAFEDYEPYELNVVNVDGVGYQLGLDINNSVTQEVVTDAEDNPCAWDEWFKNPFTGMNVAEFVKNDQGKYDVTSAETKNKIVSALFGYDRAVDTLTVTVADKKITEIEFKTDLYVDDYGDTLCDSGKFVISEHGSATTPSVEAKPVVAEHQQLTDALAAMGNNFTMDVKETDLADPTSFETFKEVFTEDAYYSTREYNVGSYEEPVYQTAGFIGHDTLGVYQFSKTEEGTLSLVSNYPDNEIADLLNGKFTGFNVALFESKGNGVFKAYEDTISLVAPFVVLDEAAVEGVTELEIVVSQGHISKINYVYEYSFFGIPLGEYAVETVVSNYGTSVIDLDLNGLRSEIETYSSILEDMLGVWMNEEHSLKFSKLGVICDGVKVSQVAVNGNEVSFTLGEDNYVATFYSESDEVEVVVNATETFTLKRPEKMPTDILNSIKAALGIEVSLPAVTGATYEAEPKKDDDGLDMVYILITNSSMTVEEYVTLLQDVGFVVELGTDVYMVYDVEETIWIQIYAGQTEDSFEMLIWNY